jgi:hypothetical protein
MTSNLSHYILQTLVSSTLYFLEVSVDASRRLGEDSKIIRTSVTLASSCIHHNDIIAFRAFV